jgi:predicted amidophosphoribosyltransferase
MFVCCKCGKNLEPIKTQFTYLGQTFSTEVQRCPSCGQALITEELAVGRMAEVEMTLEDK